jgi:protease I
MKALILSANKFEDSELLVPFYRLQEAGFAVEVASDEPGSITGIHGYEVRVDKTFAQIDSADYTLLVLPGGKAPATIRDDPAVKAVVRAFFAAGKPVGAICHGPQVLVSAGLLDGRRATCYRTMADELRNAGAEYRDSEVVVDGTLVTSRHPGDLPAFLRELLKLVPQ